MDQAEALLPVIVFCPCCAAAVDGTAGQTAWQCSCGQEWTMTVDAGRLAAHAL